jgi:hypothetical protein
MLRATRHPAHFWGSFACEVIDIEGDGRLPTFRHPALRAKRKRLICAEFGAVTRRASAGQPVTRPACAEGSMHDPA